MSDIPSEFSFGCSGSFHASTTPATPKPTVPGASSGSYTADQPGRVPGLQASFHRSEGLTEDAFVAPAGGRRVRMPAEESSTQESASSDRDDTRRRPPVVVPLARDFSLGRIRLTALRRL